MTEMETRTQNLKNLREFHKQNLLEMGIKEAFIVPKILFTPVGMNEPCISLFKSEVSKTADLYVEFTNRLNEPSDVENRTLYVFKHNPYYESEYQTTPVSQENSSEMRYLVPASELQVVWKKSMVKPKTLSTRTVEDVFGKLPDPDEDLPISQLTILDLAAIIWKKPVSRKKFLNDAISRQ